MWLLLFFPIVFGQIPPLEDLLETANSLQSNVSNSQMQHDMPFDPPLSLQQIKGLYPSYIQLNFFGGPDMQKLRHSFEILDNNMFVTAWIAQILLQVYQEGVIKVDTEQITPAVNALSQFRDRNRADGSSVCNFWTQTLENGTWVADPQNLNGLCEDVEWCTNSEFLYAFRIPADVDDSSVNLGVGAFLRELQADFPEAYTSWQQTNSNPSVLASLISQYAYRPFDSDFNRRSIDPRTYNFLHTYLEGLDTTSSVALPATWLQNIDETRTLFYAGYVMPFNVDNVDATVGANFLYGVTHFLMAGWDSDWFDSDLQQVYLDTAQYIAWCLNSSRIQQRPDLGLTYYPPFYDVLWMAARTVAIVGNSSPPFEVISEAANLLKNSLQTAGLKLLNTKAQIVSATNYTYWDDFLGAADKDADGNPINSADDRLFSTAVALNSLLDTWTQWNDKGCREWQSTQPDTLANVKNLVEGSVRFLTYESFSGNYRADNAFFSGSVKTSYDLPFFYPSNFNQFLNGTNFPNPNSPEAGRQLENGDDADYLITAVSGVIDANDYAAMLNKLWYGQRVTQEFTSYNEYPGELVFWDSHPLTYAVDLLALSKYIGMVQCGTN